MVKIQTLDDEDLGLDVGPIVMLIMRFFGMLV